MLRRGGYYKIYGWGQVQTILHVTSAKITGITSEPVIIATKTFSNKSSYKATFDASISDQIVDTVESNWSKTDTIDVGQTITYSCSFPGGSVGGETSLSYSHSWGQGGSESKEITVGSETGVSVELDPGETVEAVLSASRGVMMVRIVYTAYLAGGVAVNYEEKYRDHHYWCLDIGGVMSDAGLQKFREFTEDIKIGYYSNSKVEIRDAKGRLRALFSDTVKPAV